VLLALSCWSLTSAAQAPADEAPAPGEPPTAPFPDPPAADAPAPLDPAAPAPAQPADAGPPPAWTQTPLPPRSPEPPSPAGREPPSSEAPDAAPRVEPSSSALSVEPLPAPRKRDDSHGVLGPLRIGAMVGVGVPSLLSFGGTLKLTRYFGAGVNVGLIPRVQLAYYGEATLSYQAYDVYGRIHPFGGGFFVGTGVGYARATGTLDRRFDTSEYAPAYPGLPDAISSSSEGSVQALVLTPQLGYFHIFDGGFSVGVDFGAQIPIAPSEIEFDTRLSYPVPAELVEQYLGPNNQRVRDTLETIGRTPLPAMNLRIGWLL